MGEFRKARATDANAIAGLYKVLVPNAPINVLPERIAEITRDKNTYLVVYDADDTIIATALVILCNDVMFTRQPFALVENVIVSRDHQRKGIGKGLMEHIETFCLNADCSKIMLLGNSTNQKAYDFYTAMGYDPTAKYGFIKKRRHFKPQEKTSCDLPVQE